MKRKALPAVSVSGWWGGVKYMLQENNKKTTPTKYSTNGRWECFAAWHIILSFQNSIHPTPQPDICKPGEQAELKS